LEEASRADLEAFLGDLLRRRAPATAATRYKVLRILYRWLEEEEEIEANPLARMKPPIVPEQPVPVVPEDGLRRLLAVCAGEDFEARRDTAIITLLLDTGARSGEFAGLKLSDVDFDLDVLLVLGKGRRERALPFGRKSALSLDRYLRARARHPLTHLEWLWLGKKGGLTASGLAQMLERRGDQARRSSRRPARRRPARAGWESRRPARRPGGAGTRPGLRRPGGRRWPGPAPPPPPPPPARPALSAGAHPGPGGRAGP
jgi:site-specific recombinase XerD